MSGPGCPVSPVPEGPAEGDQLQTGTRLRMEDGAGAQIFLEAEVWEGGKMEEMEGVL